MQGSAFGGGDEIVAAGAAGLNLLTGRDPDKNFGELYDAYLGRERGYIDQFRDTNPVAAYGTEIAGAIPTAALGLLNAPAAATTAGRYLAGAGTAAGQGAIYGFNAGDGGADDRLWNAVETGAIAAPIGALAVPAGAGVRSLVNNLKTTNLAQQAGINSRAAYDAIVRTGR